MPLGNALMQTIIKAQEQQAAGRNKLALQTYLLAVAVAKEGTEEEFVTTNLLGQFYDDTLDHGMAVDCFRRAQSLASKIFGADSLQLAVAIGNESMVYLNRRDQKKGAPLLDKAAKLLRSSDRAKFAALPAYMISAPISVLCNAAANNMLVGNAKEAVAIAKDAFAIAEQNLDVLDPTYMQAGFELCMFMSAAGRHKEEAVLKEKLMKQLLDAGCDPAQLMQTLTQAFGNITGGNLFVDGFGQGLFDEPDFDLGVERASNVVPFPGAKAVKPSEQKSPALSKASGKAIGIKSKVKATKLELEPAGVVMKITLDGVSPPIWRRISIETDVSLAGLHEAIQMAMGWSDSHLHEFQVGRYRFGDSEGSASVISEHDCAISDIELKVGTKFSYLYDFGDGWKHTIEIEKLLTEEELDDIVVFIKAKGACPPEDCGGPYGFMQMMEALKGGSVNKDMRDWLEMMELTDYDADLIPDCFEEQLVAESKKKAKAKVTGSKKASAKTKTKSVAKAKAKAPVRAEPKAKAQSQVKSVAMQPESVAATAKKKSGKLEWPGSR